MFQDLSVKLSDFGLTRQKISDATTPGALQTLARTWPYMAPEMHVQHHKNQKYSDIWSLAITAIELFTQQCAWRLNPSKEEHKQELLEKKMNKIIPEGLADVLEAVRPLLATCLNYNYSERPTAGYIKYQLAMLKVPGMLHFYSEPCTLLISSNVKFASTYHPIILLYFIMYWYFGASNNWGDVK